MNRIRRRRRDERGAILVMATVGVVLAVISAALAVDLGRIAQERRRDQKVADLAALDAVRDLSQVDARAKASAARNGFPTSAGFTVTGVEGLKVGGSCVATPGAGTACVTVTSPVDNAFQPGSRTIRAVAVAGVQPYGGFKIGSSLATIDTSRSTLLNHFVGRMLGNSALNVSLVSWQGLATGRVTLEALRTELAKMGFTVGSVSQLLSANLTAAQILQATAAALNGQGEVAQANVLNSIRATVTNNAQITLGQFIHVAQGADNTALSSNMNVFQLLTATAQVANGNNFVDVPNVGITVPGVTSTQVRLQVIEPPQFYFGPPGVAPDASVSTGQIDLTVTPTLDLDVSIAGLTGAKVVNAMPVRVTGAGATGTLTDITCGTGGGMTVNVDPHAFYGSATTGTPLRLSALVLGIRVPLLDIPVTSSVPSVDGAATDLFWSHPSEFPPPEGTETTKHAGSQPIGLQGVTQLTAGNPVVLGALPLPTGTAVTGVLNALQPVIGNLDNNIFTPLLTALGVGVGSADVTALTMTCNSPTLVG